jgi:hypothetical protein
MFVPEVATARRSKAVDEAAEFLIHLQLKKQSKVDGRIKTRTLAVLFISKLSAKNGCLGTQNPVLVNHRSGSHKLLESQSRGQ